MAHSEEAPEWIGPYRLLHEVGEGGMGVVYAAEQREPIRRLVALKVIKPGMDSREVLARFEAERQALALLHHPNIASVLDAGTTERGRPYFAMEFVKGVPITEYCDANKVPIPERLRLFMQVCRGLQHAHDKGVIHRDIKPSNVFVTLIDGTPTVKVIDFGVAKAINQRLTERTLFTEEGRLIGTPEYMSPEQSELKGLEVDARIDVYSLGVLLYELLTGSLPFDPQELRQAGFLEIQRRIREVDPPTPSRRFSTTGAMGHEIAARRRCDRTALIRTLRSDLDWITMMAMAKHRSDRYATANEFAADLDRFLTHRPVVARPIGALRRFVRRFRRHPVRYLLIAAGTLGVLGLAIVALRQTQEADRLRELLEVRVEGVTSSGERRISYLDRWPNGKPKSEGKLEDDTQTGLWQFYHENGNLRAEGHFEADVRVGEWAWWHGDGTLGIRGAFDELGRREGLWTFWDQDGSKERELGLHDGLPVGLTIKYGTPGQGDFFGCRWQGQWIGAWYERVGAQIRVHDFPVPGGIEAVVEVRADGAIRRAGVLQGGEPVGPWISFHENGAKRLVCSFDAGRPSGSWSIWDEQDARSHRGTIDRDHVASDAASEFRLPAVSPSPTWTPASLAAGTELPELLATWLMELQQPVDGELVSTTAASIPDDRLATLLEALRQAKEPHLEWTVVEQEQIGEYVQAFLEKRDASPPAAPRVRPEDLEGRRLPATRLRTAGGVFDLDALRGKRVLLVVLRGFHGQVIVYGTAITEALSHQLERLRELEVAVVVVYPGAADLLPAFEAEVKTTFENAPPYTLCYDPELQFVRSLGVDARHEAFRSWLLIDAGGVVRDAFIAGHDSRRVEDTLTEFIEQLR